MSRLIDDGGLAFPVNETRFFDGSLNNEATYGMGLRDYFAAKAMQGLMAADTEWTMPVEVISKLAYSQADSMLKAKVK
jgi:hypothetical protein